MYLPQVRLFQKRYGGDEIFFETDQELMRVLSQDNPVYLVLDLPGLKNKIIICFPTQTITRVYATNSIQQYFIGESEIAKHPIWVAPAEVSYRYGMNLLPWMFLGDLDSNVPIEQDHIVNYIVLNCCVGYQGINIRLYRTNGGQQKKREWIEINQFSTGNEYRFADEWSKQSRMIARFVPNNLRITPITWQPEGGWGKYNSVKIPCKI